MPSKAKMNGSVDILAKAMRQVFCEEADPLQEDVIGVKKNAEAVTSDIAGLKDGAKGAYTLQRAERT